VYQVGIEEAAPVVVKFYRPGRWTEAAILEEHHFAQELAEAEIRLWRQSAAIRSHCSRMRAFALRPSSDTGRWPELGLATEREWMGRFLGRIHALGRRASFQHRPRWSIEALGDDSREFVLAEGWLPEHLVDAYESLTADLLEQARQWFDSAGAVRYCRLHGDWSSWQCALDRCRTAFR